MATNASDNAGPALTDPATASTAAQPPGSGQAAAIAEDNAEEFAQLLDIPEMGQYQNVFLDAAEDGDFWDDDNIAAFLGDIDGI
jgi:hypothetical protein